VAVDHVPRQRSNAKPSRTSSSTRSPPPSRNRRRSEPTARPRPGRETPRHDDFVRFDLHRHLEPAVEQIAPTMAREHDRNIELGIDR
jgi:hypothetical protein